MYTQWQEELAGRILSLEVNKTAFYRTGQQTVNIAGVVSVNKGTYTITPTALPSFSGNERTSQPEEATAPHNLKVLNISGQILFTSTASVVGNYFILPTDVLTGVFYIIRVYSDNCFITSKIVLP